MLHGLYENSTDRNDITDILGLISCQIRPKNVSRIGCTVGSRPRPVRIEMFSPADSNAILSSTSALQRYSSTKHLRLSPWLSEQDMKKVRAARKRCKELNDAASPSHSGTKLYVVVNGEIKVRDKLGKLISYKEPSSVATALLMPAPISHHRRRRHLCHP
jgi:hypothetical protein